jgi:hypothetical protein
MAIPPRILALQACGPAAAKQGQPSTQTAASHSAEPQPLCALKSRYTVEPNNMNKPISTCSMYFYVRFISSEAEEKWLQIVIQRAQPVPIEEGYPSPSAQILPYWYRWVVRDPNGGQQRAWLAHFIERRDGLYHTIVTQPEEEWFSSHLEIYFEDVNGDGVDEDVIYEVPIAPFLPTQVL